MTARSAVLLLAALAVPALAQSNDGYDPSRACRFYAMQKLPVPVRCMAELLGNWSAHPYIDGEFMFRNREQFLAWRDREEYRHWKAHDYSWQAGGSSAPVSEPPPVSQPAAQPAPMAPAAQPAPAQPAAALFCPAELPARLVPAPQQGWTGSDGLLTLRLEGVPRTEGATLICSYGPGHVTLTRPAWGRCTVRSDGKGFDCTP